MVIDAPGRLRQLLAQPGLIWGPGVYDGISARIADRMGFPVLYMTGAGTAASRIGQPDLGLTTASEVVENAQLLQAVVGTPLIADADTGFGGVINVVRTVHMYEQAGVAGIHIEDQTYPKRCGHLRGKTVIERDEFLRRIRAAAAERWNRDFVIIARTDARAPLGFEEALARVRGAFEAGADVGFLEAPESMAEVERIARTSEGPMLLNMATNGRTPSLRVREIEALGFRLAVWPAACMVPAALAMAASLEELRREGTDMGAQQGRSPEDFFRMVGLDEGLALDQRYAAAANAAEHG